MFLRGFWKDAWGWQIWGKSISLPFVDEYFSVGTTLIASSLGEGELINAHVRVTQFLQSSMPDLT